MKTANEILYPDEIADILDSVGGGTMIEIYSGTIPITWYVYHESQKYSTIERIYEEIENEYTVLLDGENILNL